MSGLGARVFAAYSRNSGNSPGDHFDRNAAEQWMQQALDEVMGDWAIVPREPTLEMFRAHVQWVLQPGEEVVPDAFLRANLPDFRQSYHALIEAAPQP